LHLRCSSDLPQLGQVIIGLSLAAPAAGELGDRLGRLDSIRLGLRTWQEIRVTGSSSQAQ